MIAGSPRLWSAVVLAVGLVAGAVVVPLAIQGRRADRAEGERQVLSVARSTLAHRAAALGRAVRGPAMAFDLDALPSEEVTGLLRLVYAQADGIAAVTLLDRDGNPVALADAHGTHAPLPAVFMARAGAMGGAHPVESLEDLARFSQHIPLAAALAHGRAVNGPYPSVRGDGARVAIAEAVPVDDGTATWVLAAEIDAAGLLDGIVVGASSDVALVGPDVIVGSLARSPGAARAAVFAQARRVHGLDGTLEFAGRDWRAIAQRAPEGLDGVVALVVSGEDDRARRTRNGALGLGVLVASIVGALAVVLWFVLRDGETAGSAQTIGARTAHDARVLGAVVKELANPVAAASAAAKLVAQDPANAVARGRAVETLGRSTLRLERSFRRVARLARAGEERPREPVDLGALTSRAVARLRSEFDQLAIESTSPTDPVRVLADPEDLELLVEVLLDASRAVAPPRSPIAVTVDATPSLRVTDTGAMPARERRALIDLGEGTRTATAAPALGWALAARIASDQHATLEVADGPDGRVEVRVLFARARG